LIGDTAMKFGMAGKPGELRRKEVSKRTEFVLLVRTKSAAGNNQSRVRDAIEDVRTPSAEFGQ
jgi:hypothetical protein